MDESRTSAIAIRVESTKAWGSHALQTLGSTGLRLGTWFVEIAQQFGAVLSALMGPAVFSAYALAAWSLAGNFGWTDTFLFTTGPLSNWLIWLSLAIIIHLAASILTRHTATEK